MIDRTTTRRTFLQSATGAAIGVCVGGRLGRSEERFGEWPVGIQSYTLRKFTAAEAIRHIQGLGVHNVELSLGHLPLDSTSEQVREMLATLTRAQIHVRGHGVHEFSDDHTANRRIFEFAQSAGVRNLTANPTPEAFESLERLVDEFNIRICIHNHGPDALYDSLGDVQRAVNGRHPLIGACVDTGHTLRSGEDPVEWVRQLGPRVFALHLKDVAEKQKRTHNVVLGTSFLDLVGIFQALRDVQFPGDGVISLEYEANPENPIDDVKQCLVAAAAAIKQVG